VDAVPAIAAALDHQLVLTATFPERRRERIDERSGRLDPDRLDPNRITCMLCHPVRHGNTLLAGGSVVTKDDTSAQLLQEKL
jgi:hypothetical protein